MKFCCLLTVILFSINCFAQVRATIPWSNMVNVTFGTGNTNPGPPLSNGHSDFKYTSSLCPETNTYGIVTKENCATPSDSMSKDAGHVYFGPHPLDSYPGYMMLLNYQSSPTSKIVYSDTVRNLCVSTKYLFWAGINRVTLSPCFYPNFNFNIETLSGQLIQYFSTGDIGGATDNARGYFGVQGIDIKAPFPYFYGGIFTLPPGVNDIVVKIVTNPGADLPCTNMVAIDNIELSPIGPDINISIDDDPDGWLTGTCYTGNKPVNLTGNISKQYLDFATSEFVADSYNNPAVQWQQSVDNGYTWSDIPGETSLHLSKVFSVPDTFFVRLRVSENQFINNKNCSNISNIIQVQVDGLPKDFDITSNSPVCTDSDIAFNIYGGSSYFITGPNGYNDNTSFPHIYHPVLADSGWYYVRITSFGGCVVNDSTYVRVFGPDLKISVDDSAVCYGRSTQLHSSGGSVYLWSPSNSLSNANIASPVAKPLTTTKYQLMVTDGSGCSAYGFLTIKLRDSMLKAAIIAPNIVCPNDAVLFKDTSVGKITRWQWDFANGQTSNEHNPPLQRYPFYEANLNYPVRLAVADSSGCADTTSVFVKAVNSCYIAVPSAFTPNHDGLNDYLYPLNAYKATNLIFRIYNKSGKLIFETKDWTKKWDGTISGMPQPTGTYVWVLDYTDENNKSVSLKGTTVLIR
jgi:gliding motility-associated-like protein